jgi:hypothetical protein
MSNRRNEAVLVRIGNGLSDAIRGPGEAFESLNNGCACPNALKPEGCAAWQLVGRCPQK